MAVSVDDGRKGYLLKVACETDFLAKGDGFQSMLDELTDVITECDPDGLADGERPLMTQGRSRGEGTVTELLTEAVSQIGENISTRPSLRDLSRTRRAAWAPTCTTTTRSGVPWPPSQHRRSGADAVPDTLKAALPCTSPRSSPSRASTFSPRRGPRRSLLEREKRRSILESSEVELEAGRDPGEDPHRQAREVLRGELSCCPSRVLGLRRQAQEDRERRPWSRELGEGHDDRRPSRRFQIG